MKKNPLIYYLLGIISVMMYCSVPAAALQPSVVVDGLRYEKIAEGKAKLAAIADEDQYCKAITDNGLKLHIPDFVVFNENDSLKVTVIANRSLEFDWMMERFDYQPINVSLPAYLEELGHTTIDQIAFIDTLTVRSYYPPVTNVGILFGINFCDPFPFASESFINKIIIPSGSHDLYSNAPGWSYYKCAEEGMEECDSLPIIKSDRFIEYDGYVGKPNSIDNAEITLLYKVPAPNETELNIPSQIESNGVIYTVTTLGDDMFMGAPFRKVHIPPTVKRIKSTFFYSNVTEITGMEGLEEAGMCAFGAPDLRKLTLPESLTRMTDSMFRFGKAKGYLDELVLPSTLTEIEDVCFHMVTLKKVISKNPVAPKADRDMFVPFWGDDYCGDLFVPEGSEESYLEQPGWRWFARINGVKYADYVTPLYDQATITTHGRSISITTASELRYEIYSSAGVMVTAGTTQQDIDIALENPGIYVVKVSAASSSAAPLTTKIAIR